MSQVSAAVTDLVTAGVLCGCAYAAGHAGSRWWPAAFSAAATGSLVGAIHHLAFRPATTLDRGSAASFAVAGIALVVALASLLAASAVTLNVRPRGRFTALGWCCAALFVVAVAAGKGTVGPLVVSQLASMLSIVGLWVVASAREVPGARLVVAAFLLTAASASAFVLPVRSIGLGLGIDPVTFQHLLQLPGMVLIAFALRSVARWRDRPVGVLAGH